MFACFTTCAQRAIDARTSATNKWHLNYRESFRLPYAIVKPEGL